MGLTIEVFVTKKFGNEIKILSKKIGKLYGNKLIVTCPNYRW